MHHWSWQVRQEIPYLTCSLLAPWPHGFFTRQTWPQTPQELVGVLQPQAEVLRVKQVHGNQILSAQTIQAHLEQQPSPSEEVLYPEADGLYSNGSQQSVWVCSADCTPALIADVKTGQVAAVHAGWRGTAARILPEAIAQLQEQGSQLQDLRVAMGPAIEGSVYQVTTEVAAEVGRSLFALDGASPATDAEVLETLMTLPTPPILPDETEGRVKLDVRCINALQLEQLGLAPDAIAIAPHCTYQDPDRFFSYRRDSRRQVQWSGIVS